MAPKTLQDFLTFDDKLVIRQAKKGRLKILAETEPSSLGDRLGDQESVEYLRRAQAILQRAKLKLERYWLGQARDAQDMEKFRTNKFLAKFREDKVKVQAKDDVASKKTALKKSKMDEGAGQIVEPKKAGKLARIRKLSIPKLRLEATPRKTRFCFQSGMWVDAVEADEKTVDPRATTTDSKNIDISSLRSKIAGMANVHSARNSKQFTQQQKALANLTGKTKTLDKIPSKTRNEDGSSSEEEEDSDISSEHQALIEKFRESSSSRKGNLIKPKFLASPSSSSSSASSDNLKKSELKKSRLADF